jgi:origin recognition complex subunit 5
MFSSLYAEHAARPEDLLASLDDSDDEDGSREIDAWRNPAAAAARAQRKRERERARDEAWEDEVDHLTFSTKLWALIPELEAQGLLRRASPVDRLDNVMFRCEADYETVKTLAKQLRVTLDEYLYEDYAG